MHLWPSLRIRDSFKEAYLKNLEWNLHRMNSQKQQQNQTSSSSSNNQQKLLDDKNENCSSGLYRRRGTQLRLILEHNPRVYTEKTVGVIQLE